LAENHAGVSVKKLTETKDENQTRTDTKLAETFPTNRTYINAAAKIIETAATVASDPYTPKKFT
jgi:hypothetical protein